MAGIRVSRLRSLSNSLYSSLKPSSLPLYSSYTTLTRIADHSYVRASYAHLNSFYDKRETQSAAMFMNTPIRVAASDPLADTWVATAFAAKDILGNVLSGLSMQFSKPFSLGDTIKAGSIEGQVVEMGLTNTTLLNSEKFPVLVPNSLFSSQVCFSQVIDFTEGMMVAPSTIASQYVTQAWRGAVILSCVWFLYRWKTNLLARALATHNLAGTDREKLLTLDRVSSIGLFVVGLMALAEACGVAVQSILTVGGIGGVYFLLTHMFS
ncbi:hypothetical protein GOBAR_DD15547 [Gossypium barbadense]|nr:hypothetical protein GOBAR_DD15547 [Gossypium barbadense]